MKSKALLLGGTLGPGIYVLTVFIGGIVRPNYNYLIQTVSELQQTGAPHGVLLSSLFVCSAAMIFVFGLAVMAYYGRQNKLVAIGGLFIVLHAVGAILLATVFLMPSPDTPAPEQEGFRLAIAGGTALVTMVLIILIGIGLHRSVGIWRHFRLYSILTVITMLVCGMIQPLLMTNGIELVGLFERLTHLSYLQWIVTLSLKSYSLAKVQR